MNTTRPAMVAAIRPIFVGGVPVGISVAVLDDQIVHVSETRIVPAIQVPFNGLIQNLTNEGLDNLQSYLAALDDTVSGPELFKTFDFFKKVRLVVFNTDIDRQVVEQMIHTSQVQVQLGAVSVLQHTRNYHQVVGGTLSPTDVAAIVHNTLGPPVTTNDYAYRAVHTLLEFLLYAGQDVGGLIVKTFPGGLRMFSVGGCVNE